VIIPNKRPVMTISHAKCSHAKFACVLLLGSMLAASAAHALGQQVGREEDITDLKLGQRVMVDDGTCPAGQIKVISGAKMTPQGVARTRQCSPRSGAKQR
jgi:hypothetical protein